MYTIDLDNLITAAEPHALQFRGHRLPQLMRQYEGRLVLHIKVPAQRQRGLALDLIAEDRGRGEIVAERHLVKREQRAAGDAEILPAGFAPEPKRTRWAAALVDGRAFTVRADRLAIGPAEIAKHRLGFLVRHAKDGAQGERPGLC